jgi:hypothetical protein
MGACGGGTAALLLSIPKMVGGLLSNSATAALNSRAAMDRDGSGCAADDAASSTLGAAASSSR